MRESQQSVFEYNDRKLSIYLDNVQQGFVVLEINDYMVIQDKRKLMREKGIEVLEFDEYKEGFIPYIQGIGRRDGIQRVCFTGFTEEPLTYDLVKSLNLTRESIRQIGLLVLILPSFLVRQIEEDEPNLADYITLKLDYREHIPFHFFPTFAFTYQRTFSKQERHTMKKIVLQNIPQSINTIEDYNNYLEQYRYIRMNDLERKKLKEEYLWTTNMIVHDFEWNSELELINAQVNLWNRTAEIFCLQWFLQDALELFEESERLLQENGSQLLIARINTLEGEAYCNYLMGQYALAYERLEQCIALFSNQSDNSWRGRIYNDCGVCLYHMNRYEDALTAWQKSADVLQQSNDFTVLRKLRNKYNQLLAHMKCEANIRVYYDDWIALGDELQVARIQYEEQYGIYQLVTAWIEGALLGRLHRAIELADDALEINQRLLPENDFTLALNWNVLAQMYIMVGDASNSKLYLQKSNNVLSNLEKRDIRKSEMV